MARQTHFGAEFHQRLVELPGVTLRYQLLGDGPDSLLDRDILGAAFDAEDPAQDSRHIAVHQRLAPTEGDAGDGPGGVAADARQRQQILSGLGQMTAESCDNFLRGPVQIPGARVVAETLPQFDHRIETSARQLLDGREPLEKPLVVGHHRRDPRLLQHDLGDPDGIWIFGSSPRQISGIFREPVEKGLLHSERIVPRASFLGRLSDLIFLSVHHALEQRDGLTGVVGDLDRVGRQLGIA